MADTTSSDMPSDLFYVINYSLKFVVTLIGLVFGFIIILTVIFKQQCHTVANLLVCSTCLGTIGHMTIAFVAAIYGVGDHWAWAEPYCTIRGYLSVSFIGTMCYSYSLQAVSRMFFAVFYKYPYLLSMRTHLIMVIANWCLGFSVAAIPLLFYERGYGLEIESRACIMSSKVFGAAMFASIFSYSIPLGIVTLVYGVIFYQVRQSSRRVTAFNDTSNSNLTRTNAKRELRIARQLVQQSGCLLGAGGLYLVNMFWQKFTTIPLPKPMYLVGFTIMTNMFSLMIVFQFFMNKSVRDIVYRRFRKNNDRTTDMTINFTQRI